ncbi:hypothetical protein J6590_017611 [Homalodisca vitripennis]|nr:hypothetical protein J6590_017611 [Homalodisca vitripennis]
MNMCKGGNNNGSVCQQDVVNNLAKELMFDFEVMVGGHMKRLITHPNFRPVDLFVSSIGAAGKLTTSGLYNMSYVRHIVMDEADTCMDDSFSDYVVRYLKKFPISYGRDQTDNESLPPFCQLTLVSATMPTSLPMILEDIIVVWVCDTMLFAWIFRFYKQGRNPFYPNIGFP